jgi:hypothetical protein
VQIQKVIKEKVDKEDDSAPKEKQSRKVKQSQKA